jgi:phosphatidylglycerophosphate synthase
MLDRALQGLLKPTLDRAGAALARAGIGADAVTWVGFALGMAAAAAIALQRPLAGLALILASRLADGLDGAVARHTRPTDRGAFLDITLDFIFYASIPLAFALADPAAHGLASAVLLAAFVGTGSSFLAFAALAGKRGMANPAYPGKGLYYLGGLTEASETLACFVAMCLWPAGYVPLALGYALLCGVTIVARLVAGWRLLS